MHIIYLAGNNVNNRTWIEKVKANFDSFSTGDILYYDHWQSGEKWINLEKESKRLQELIKDKKDYFVFSKSVGSVLALKNIYGGKLKAKKMVICGLPYRAGKKEFNEIDECLKTLKVPTMFIQNEFDPVYSFKELADVLANDSPADYHLIKNPGNDTHDYENYENLAKLTKIYFGDKDKQIHLEKIYKALDVVAKKINSLNIKWLLGASGALMVHGVKIVPWDLDVLTTPENIDKLKNEFKDYFVSEDDDGLLLKINDIEVEIIKLNDLGKPISILFQGNLIPVNTLENELYFYKQRPEKENTIRLIEEKLESEK